MWCALFVCSIALLFLTMTGSTDAVSLSNPKEYRVVVEPILTPPGAVAIYRVQLRSSSEHPINLDFDGGQISQPLTPKFVSENVWQADLVILVEIRPNPDATLRSKASEVVYRLLKSGSGGLTFVEQVDVHATLEQLIEVKAGEYTRKLGEKCLVARLNGKAIEVCVLPA
ncbi:MAG: hypothetical protein K8U57_20255 [Planctomycetes bacterium]|nr:hypothetical protein [Planctomycetota bacterium]